MTKLTNSRGYCGAHAMPAGHAAEHAMHVTSCAELSRLSNLHLSAWLPGPLSLTPLTTLNPSSSSTAVELAAAAIIIVGSRYGLPLSTTHCMVG